MPKRKQLRKHREKLRQKLIQEGERLKNLRLTDPDLFRLCGPYNRPCCQALTHDGTLCKREALTTSTYINRLKCCLLCWQHAIGYGVYGILKVVQGAAENQLSWDEYCAIHPKECLKYFEK